jgi:hypothetical protein
LHRYEIVAKLSVPTGLANLAEGSATAEIISDAAFRACLAWWSQQTDVSILQSTVDLFPLNPTPSGYSAGDRTVHCVIDRLMDERHTYDFDATESDSTFVSPFAAEPAVCYDSDLANLLTLTRCDRPYEFEVIAVIDGSAVPRQSVMYLDYTAPPEVFAVGRGDWPIVCAVFPDGTGSMQGVER